MATEESLQTMLSNLQSLQTALKGVNTSSGNSQSLIQVLRNPKFNDLTKDFAVPSQNNYTAQNMADRLGVNYDLGSIQDTYRNAIDQGYGAASADYQRAQNNYYGTVLNSGNLTLEAIRRARASGIQSGQNTGANWLQELTAAIASGQQTSTDATALAHQSMALADQYTADLSEAEQAALEYYNSLGLQLGSHGNDVAALDLQQYIAELQAELTAQTNQTQADIAGLQAAASLVPGNGYTGNGYSYGGTGTGTGTVETTAAATRTFGPYEQAVFDNTSETDTFREQKLAAARIMDANFYGKTPDLTDVNTVNLAGTENIWNTTAESGNNPMASGQLNNMSDNIWKNVTRIAANEAVYYVPGADGRWVRSDKEEDKASYVKGGVNIPANAQLGADLDNPWVHADTDFNVNQNLDNVDYNKVSQAISAYVSGDKKSFDSLNYWEKQSAANRVRRMYDADTLNSRVLDKTLKSSGTEDAVAGSKMPPGVAQYQKTFLDATPAGMMINIHDALKPPSTTPQSFRFQDRGMTPEAWFAGLTPEQRNAYQNDSSQMSLDYALASSLINNPNVIGQDYTLEGMFPRYFGEESRKPAPALATQANHEQNRVAGAAPPALDVIGLGQGPLTQEAAQRFAAQQQIPTALRGLNIPGMTSGLNFGKKEDDTKTARSYMGMRKENPQGIPGLLAQLKAKLTPAANSTAVRANTLAPGLAGSMLGNDQLARLREKAEAQRKASASSSSTLGGNSFSAGLNSALAALSSQAATPSRAPISASAPSLNRPGTPYKPPASLSTQANYERDKALAAQAQAAAQKAAANKNGNALKAQSDHERDKFLASRR